MNKQKASNPAKNPHDEHHAPSQGFNLLTLSRTTWGIFTPLRKHLIWGIPLPAATGWKEREVNTELAGPGRFSLVVLRRGGGDDMGLDRTAAWGRGFPLLPTPDAERPLRGANAVGYGRVESGNRRRLSAQVGRGQSEDTLEQTGGTYHALVGRNQSSSIPLEGHCAAHQTEGSRYSPSSVQHLMTREEQRKRQAIGRASGRSPRMKGHPRRV